MVKQHITLVHLFAISILLLHFICHSILLSVRRIVLPRCPTSTYCPIVPAAPLLTTRTHKSLDTYSSPVATARSFQEQKQHAKTKHPRFQENTRANLPRTILDGSRQRSRGL